MHRLSHDVRLLRMWPPTNTFLDCDATVSGGLRVVPSEAFHRRLSRLIIVGVQQGYKMGSTQGPQTLLEGKPWREWVLDMPTTLRTCGARSLSADVKSKIKTLMGHKIVLALANN